MKKKVIPYIVAFAVAFAIVLLVCGLRGLFGNEPKDKATIIVALCDAFFISGAMFLCFSALAWASDKGAFDGIGYGLSSLFGTHKIGGKRSYEKPNETYQEYVERKHAPEKKKTQPMMFLIDALFLLVAIVLLAIYRSF